jgi:ribonuclease VapC
MMNWVNIGEMAYIVERRWGGERLYAALATIEATPLGIEPVERDLALAAGHIKARYPVAHADAFAAALARHHGAALVTGDPESESLEQLVEIRWLPQCQR